MLYKMIWIEGIEIYTVEIQDLEGGARQKKKKLELEDQEVYGGKSFQETDTGFYPCIYLEERVLSIRKQQLQSFDVGAHPVSPQKSQCMNYT